MATQCSHLIDAACEVLSAPSLAEVFWEMVRIIKEEKVLLRVSTVDNLSCFVQIFNPEAEHGIGDDPGQRSRDVSSQDRAAVTASNRSFVKQVDR